jgi:hypothetical protein
VGGLVLGRQAQVAPAASSLLKRVVIVSSHHVFAAARSASERACLALTGSSTTIRSPPSPVATPPTDVARRMPVAVVSYRVLASWSRVSCHGSSSRWARTPW